MDELRVDLGDRAYPIRIGQQLLTDPTSWAGALPTRSAVVTTQTVAPLYLDAVCELLGKQGRAPLRIVLPDGESAKNWDTLNLIFDALLSHQCDRKTVLVALGGGVVGDMTGFAAATYQRGVPFIQVPTTLLSQVDSSVGGKTGINHPRGKNMIGAFYQPQLVIADTQTLSTLPDRELRAGLAEVIKYGLIYDTVFLAWLEENIGALLAREPAALTHAIRRSCEIKAEVVAQDERESGIRAILNLGHTFGHAIEAGMGYGTWLHGEAVGAGMVAAAELSGRLGYLSADEVARSVRLIERAGLPTHLPMLGESRYFDLMQVDKKADDGKIRYIVLKALGKASLQAVPATQVAPVLNTLMRAS